MRCEHGSSRSSYLSISRIYGFRNRRCIILLHSRQSSKLCWCVPHHLAGIARSIHFRASKHCFSGTSFSNLFRKSSTSFNPSYISRFLASIATQCTDLIIMLQLSVVTSCNRYCHCSISSSQSEVQELSRSHEILPLAVGFTQSCSHMVIL